MLPEKLRSHMVAPSLLIATTAKKALHFNFRLQMYKVSWIMTRRFNVLVVDDEPALRRVLQTSLTARGLSGKLVCLGREFLWLLRQTFRLDPIVCREPLFVRGRVG